MSLGLGCIELPADYSVVWDMGRVDVFAGYIEPPEKNWRMRWQAGMWGSLLDAEDGRVVEWTRNATVNGKTITLGVITQHGKSLMVAGNGPLEFSLSTKISNAEALLVAVLSRHRFNPQGLECEGPIKSDTYKTF